MEMKSFMMYNMAYRKWKQLPGNLKLNYKE